VWLLKCCRADKDVDRTHGTAGLPAQVDVDRSLPQWQSYPHRHGPRISLRQQVPGGGWHRPAQDNEPSWGAWHWWDAAGEARVLGGSGTSFCSSRLWEQSPTICRTQSCIGRTKGANFGNLWPLQIWLFLLLTIQYPCSRLWQGNSHLYFSPDLFLVHEYIIVSSSSSSSFFGNAYACSSCVMDDLHFSQSWTSLSAFASCHFQHLALLLHTF